MEELDSELKGMIPLFAFAPQQASKAEIQAMSARVQTGKKDI